jgi:hypothetical protein
VLAALVVPPRAANAGTCNIPSVACLTWTNSNTGPGLQGNSAQGIGVVGMTSINYPRSPASAPSGVYGVDLSTNTNNFSNSGVFGLSTFGFGVKAQSTYGEGLKATSVHGLGIEGDSQYASGVEGNGVTGGFFNGSGAGVEAGSSSGSGVEGLSG